MKLTRNFCISIVSLFVLLFTANLFAYDFSDVRRSLQSDSKKWNKNNQTPKVAIVFKVSGHEQIKQRFNLIRIKKNLAHDLLDVFHVADPVIVGEIMRSNQLTSEQLKSSPFLLKQFSDRTGSDHILFADFKLQGDQLNAEFILLTPAGDQISQVIMGLSSEGRLPIQKKPVTVVRQSKFPEASVFQSMPDSLTPENFDPDDFAVDEYIPDFFDTQKNDESWMFFNPTALINPYTHSIEANLWLKHFADTDIRAQRFRYDFSFKKMFQVGIEASATQERTVHSSYATVKYNAIDETVLSFPINISLGFRKRVFWNSDNIEFGNSDPSSDNNNDDDLNEQNNKRNQTTLFLAVSGKVKKLRSFYNVYLNNQTIGAGVKVSIQKKIKVFFDSYLHYYEGVDTENASDSAIGIQFYNTNGIISTLAYQATTEQTLFIVDFNF